MSRAILALPVLLLAGALEPAPPAPAPAAPAPAAVVVPRAPLSLPPVAAEYRVAAAAVRQHDFLGALRALEPLSARDDGSGRHARLVAGLYAHSLERPGDAARLLGEEPERADALEDWRLWVLADVRAATGDASLGLAALDRLLGDFPQSPLWPRAVVRATELAHQAKLDERAQALVELARGRPLPPDLAEQLERVAWLVAVERADRAAIASAATNLLTRFPQAANQLGIGDHYPVYLLPPAQLLVRAQTLLAHGMARDALQTLDATPAAARGLDWSLLMARALTAGARSSEAVALLAPQQPEVATDVARVELQRAQAELALAPPPGEATPARAHTSTAKSKSSKASTSHGKTSKGKKGKATSSRPSSTHASRGSTTSKSADREEHRKRAWEELDRAARLGEPSVAARALHLLFRDQVGARWYTSALATWNRLRAVDPDDDVGLPFLWERGWSAYRDRDYAGALRWWEGLLAEQPVDRYPRAARYWSARALDAIGQRERAHAYYVELASADTTDFYRRHALQRLGKPLAEEPVPADGVEPWPTDKLLERARYLTDVGLDALAQTEIELVGDRAAPRARAALEALVLSRQGRPRPSMDKLRIAFPQLGTPLQARVPPEALELYYPLRYREPIERWATARKLPVPLVLGVIRQESAFDLTATSAAGARGLMQLMPGTANDLARKLGVPFSSERLYDPDYSVRLGTSYLAHVVDLFDGNVELALAGYNSGPYRLKRQWNAARRRDVDAFIEDLQFEESTTYVKRILLLSDSYSRLYPELAEPG